LEIYIHFAKQKIYAIKRDSTEEDCKQLQIIYGDDKVRREGIGAGVARKIKEIP